MRKQDSRTNLPVALTSFIGRNREMEQIKRSLATSRLVTLTGAGGSGKTRLALEAANDLLAAGAYADGVWWVDLAPILDLTLVPQAIARALDLYEVPNQPLGESISNYLSTKQLLLILDNCEHLITACAQLTELLLGTCPDLRILATSREVLSIPSEQVWLVPPLSFPDPKHPLPLEELVQSESVRLFLERARAVKPEFEVKEENASAVSRICQCLDGIPLAIELAAARMRVLSAEQIVVRLAERFSLLSVGSRTALPRHQTLRALIDWSYDLSPEPERILLRRLAVFVGGCTVEAVEAVCSGEGIERRQVLDLVTHLLDKSWMIAEERSGAARYRMLETIRQYAEERLQESAETEGLRDQHLTFFLELAEQAEPKLNSAEANVWRARLDADYDNLRAALEWSRTGPDVEIEVRLASALSEFWVFSNYQSEGRQWLERALGHAQTLMVRPAVRAKVLLGAGKLTRDIGPLSAAQARIAESVGLFKELGDKWHSADALCYLGEVTAQRGDYERARTLLEESVAIARAVGDKWLLASTLSGLGDILQHAGFPRARSVLEESITLARELGDDLVLARTLMPLAHLDLTQGDYAAARSHGEQALALYRALGSKSGTAWALGGLGESARLEGDYERAEVLYDEGLSLFVEGGYGATSWILHNLGHVAQHRGDHVRAEHLFKKSLVLRKEQGEKEGMAEAFAGLAGVAAATGQPLRAARLFGAAEALRDAIHLAIRPYNRAPYDLYLPLSRAQLDEKTVAAAWGEGKAMKLEQAIEYALAETARPTEAIALETEPLLLDDVAREAYGGLTPREREVAALIARGKSNRAIADVLVVGVKTVEAHITHILGKLGFSSRAEIAGWAISKGLAEAPEDLNTQIRKS